MRLHRLLLVTVLLYVGTDLALPVMPGAFVFDAEDSVEGAQKQRGRVTEEIRPTLGPASNVVPREPLRSDDRGVVRDRPALHRGRPVSSVLPRAALTLPLSSEDPQ